MVNSSSANVNFTLAPHSISVWETRSFPAIDVHSYFSVKFKKILPSISAEWGWPFFYGCGRDGCGVVDEVGGDEEGALLEVHGGVG